MTREEAITVLKTFMENPLFSDEHKQAFNIAIHDIKAYHDWNMNNLILINKENYELAEQEPVLDKIRAEIKERTSNRGFLSCQVSEIHGAIDAIFDKYIAESED